MQPDQQAVTLRFGKFTKITGPGLHYHYPSPIEEVYLLSVMRVNREEIGFRSEQKRNGEMQQIPQESLMLTGDENIVDVNFEVYWRISDAFKYVFNMRDNYRGATVRSAAESVMRSVIGVNKISSVLAEGRMEVEVEAMKLLQSVMNQYDSGIEIVKLQMLRVDPPQAVIGAYREVQNAKSDAVRMTNQAEAYANDIIPRARGEAAKILEAAQAERTKLIADATGQTARISKVYQAYLKQPEVVKLKVYYETMEAVLQGAEIVVIDGELAKNSTVLPLIDSNTSKVLLNPPKN